MRFSMLLAALVTSLAFSGPVLADSQSDLNLCKFAGQIGKADESIAACDRVINDLKVTAANRAVAFASRCGWWWAKKDSDRALSDCNEAIKADSRYAAAYVNRGNAYLLKSDVDHAFADFSEAIRLDPKNAWAYTNRGNLYKNKGDFEHALADLNEAIRLDPNYAMVFLARGDVYRSQGDLNRAMTDLNESIRLDSNYASAYFTRGRLSYMLGNNPGALEDFTKAIKFDTEDATAYFNRGVAYFVVGGRLADAVADFKKASELNPKDAYAALWRELAERRTNNVTGHLAEAAKQLDMTVWPAPVIRQFLGELNAEQTVAAAADNDPRTKQAQTCEANFYGGELALVKKNKKEALRLLKLAADNCPRSFVESTAAIAESIQIR
ncbi:tetratricopeptide repeat protein [Bradyrhizobium sp. dw_411]|uniref:tetratricopeptide repeat protein n=1 Tax=Bradyrhizobium sp. dw_411 TaxID=2720082 RepID=UPI001BCCB746|nr:tetratricopeptide repeat protein [Bradyrhizobium sp. dw_411]